jgi:transposase
MTPATSRTHLPQAAICYDPFHLIKWAGEALDQVHLATPRDGTPIKVDGLTPAKTWQKVRTTLRAAAENLDPVGKAIITSYASSRSSCSAPGSSRRTSAVYQGLGDKAAARHLDKWCHAATRSNINAFMTLARRIHHHFDGIIAAITHRLSNSRIEGINAGIRRTATARPTTLHGCSPLTRPPLQLWPSGMNSSVRSGSSSIDYQTSDRVFT